MIVNGSTLFSIKRRRLTAIDIMEAEAAKAKVAAIKDKFGRDLRVFETSGLSSSVNQVLDTEVSDDFYEFTAADYYRLMSTKKEDKHLKTRKIREAEEAARKSRMTKAVIRVRFPDNHTLEVEFHPSEKIQNLFDLLMKAVARPEVPFYLYTAPPKKQIKDFSQDFYSAGFVPGAIVYFSYVLSQGDDAAALSSGPFLVEEIMSLKGLDSISEPSEPVESAPEPVTAEPPQPEPQQSKPAEKKLTKPKWLKM
ncbi:plant UBX domain-containing protein 1 [Mercurialis annua]|uniref:plant UBX domain-containing protein 1 n=1 Tax=Mercurialis annua TaxID=3986 RepID=UPI00215E0A81|nr:plant UBX domain-containing protein 1 [Mercurialis annua]XP_050234609.1 plant UBX domain-containing protein 1 [Mercurialis annua]